MDDRQLRSPRDLAELETVLRKGFRAMTASGALPRHRLVGTAAARLQGVELPVGDVDLLLADERAVTDWAAALWGRRCVVPPSRIAVSGQYYACFDVEGVGFSFSTVATDRDEDGWECEGPGPWRHAVPVRLGELTVDCVELELRLATELVRDRPDRYRPLLAHLRRHGADAALLRRSLAARGIAAARARDVLDFVVR